MIFLRHADLIVPLQYLQSCTLSRGCSNNECNPSQNLQCINDSVIASANSTGWWYVAQLAHTPVMNILFFQ